MPRKPFIRKQPLLEKIRSYPFDFLLWLNESRLSIDWDLYHRSIGLPLGFGLTTLFNVLVKILDYYDTSSDKKENRLFQIDFYRYEQIKRRAIKGQPLIQLTSDRTTNNKYGILFIKLLAFSIFMASVINFIKVFFISFKNYSLLNSSLSKKPNSNSAVEISLNNANEFENSIWFKLSRLFNQYPNHNPSSYEDANDSYNNESFLDDDTTEEINLIEKKIWQLKVWSPTKFPLYLFISFNPVTLMILKFLSLTTSILKLFIIVIPSVSALNYLLISNFLTLINDKQILYQEMFGEYNDKFVKPKTSTLKKNAIVDATFGPNIPAQYVVNHDSKAHLLTDKLKVFITHDINGKPFNSVNIKNSQTLPNTLLPSSTKDDLQRLHFLEAKLNFEKEQLEKEKTLLLKNKDWRDRELYERKLINRELRDRELRDRELRDHERSFVNDSFQHHTLSELYDLQKRSHYSDSEDDESQPNWISRSTPYVPKFSSSIHGSRLSDNHKPDLNPNKILPSLSSSRFILPSHGLSSRSPSPQKSMHDLYRSPNPVKYEYGSNTSSVRSLSPSRRTMNPPRYPQSDLSRRQYR